MGALTAKLASSIPACLCRSTPSTTTTPSKPSATHTQGADLEGLDDEDISGLHTPFNDKPGSDRRNQVFADDNTEEGRLSAVRHSSLLNHHPGNLSPRGYPCTSTSTLMTSHCGSPASTRVPTATGTITAKNSLPTFAMPKPSLKKSPRSPTHFFNTLSTRLMTITLLSINETTYGRPATTRAAQPMAGGT